MLRPVAGARRFPAAAFLVPTLLSAMVVVAGALLIPFGASTASTTGDQDNSAHSSAAAPPAEAGPEATPAGEHPHGSVQVYGMGLVAAGVMVGAALLTKGRFYP